MADPPPFPDAGDATRTPRWVKAFGVIALVLVLLVLVLLLTGGHGPRRHTQSADAGAHTQPSSVAERGL